MSIKQFKDYLESKLFNGYVREPIPSVLIACFVGCAFLFIATSATVDICFSVDEKAVQTEAYTLVSYYEDGPTCVLVSNSGALFAMPIKSVANYSLLDNLISEEKEIVINREDSTGINEKTHSVISISDKNGNVIISEKDINGARQNAERRALVILWCACTGYWGVIIAAYCVLCHAHRFPRLAALLVRAPYRNF